MTKQNRKSADRYGGNKQKKSVIPPSETIGPRIIGGKFRGRKLLYSGQLRTRPMKDRLREAIFNLIGDDVAGAHAVDLFAGTGALGLESLSRGAAKATLIEQHYPTADIIRQNVEALAVGSQTEIVTGDVFIWAKRQGDLGLIRRLIFCSPPYDFYVTRTNEMLELLNGLMQIVPKDSAFVVEADSRFDFSLLPYANAWNIRSYPPAVIGVYRKTKP
jgi:16S rRNA (guanine966-N2)-methyltransferase